jgi:prepilin-type N-terminal cleavage/methylation domain-containing protein
LFKRPVGDERGYTLVEMLVTVWILGAVMTALCAALFTMSKSSDYNRRLTLAETELRAYAEALQAAPYVPCEGMSGVANGSGYVNPGYRAYEAHIDNGSPVAGVYTTSDPSEVTVSAISTAGPNGASGIKYWDATLDTGTTKTFAPATFTDEATLSSHTIDATAYPDGPACDATGSSAFWDFGAQQISLSIVVSGSPQIVKSQTVIKRDTGVAPSGSPS